MEYRIIAAVKWHFKSVTCSIRHLNDADIRHMAVTVNRNLGHTLHPLLYSIGDVWHNCTKKTFTQITAISTPITPRGKLFQLNRYICNQPTRPTQTSIPPGVSKRESASAGGSFHSRTNVCTKGKTWQCFNNVCHTWALPWWSSLRERCYIKTTYYVYRHLWSKYNVYPTNKSLKYQIGALVAEQ